MRDEIIEVAKQLIRFKSITGDEVELEKCVSFIEDYFDKEAVFVKKFKKEGTPSLLITLKDTTRPKILLNAHFDVVPASEQMFKPRKEGNKLIGRGALDNKGPLAVLMVLMKHLSRLDNKPNVALLTTGDEESGGHHGVKHALNEGVTSEFALVIDGGDFNHYVTKAKGVLNLRLSAEGQEAHASRPWEGENAIEKLMQAYMDLKDQFKYAQPSDWEKTVNLSGIKGGEIANKVPGFAEMILDIRYTEEDNPEELVEGIQRVVSENEVEVEVLVSEPVFATEEENDYLQRLLQVSEKVVGEEPRVTADFGSSDARFLSEKKIPCALTYPRGGGHHSEKEYLDISCLDKFYEILDSFIKETSLPE